MPGLPSGRTVSVSVSTTSPGVSELLAYWQNTEFVREVIRSVQNEPF